MANHAEVLCTEGLIDAMRDHGMLSARLCKGGVGIVLDDEDTRRLRDLLRAAR